MSMQVFNRLAEVEAQVRALLARIEQLEQKNRACETERPLATSQTLKLKKAETSHA